MYARHSTRPPKRGRRSFSRRPSGFNKRRGSSHKKERIDFSRFVRKAEYVEAAPYVPEHTFSDFPFVDMLMKNVARKGFITPTPIQDQAIEPVLEGKDVFGLANTVTGKTGAFILPLLHRVAVNKKEKVIILAPTRELAQQIQDEFKAFSFGLGVFSVAAVGGLPIGRQIMEIKRGVSFVIGTPGRVADLIKRKALDLSSYKTVVLDEADRMLDMGFKDDMEFIIGACAKERQTLFFSATLSPEVRKLSEKYLKEPLFLSVITRDTSKNIDQDVIRAGREDKIHRLSEILSSDDAEKILIFRETKHSVDALEKELRNSGFRVAAIHGDKRNRERMKTLQSFRKSEITVLIATDVAARGLDIPDVTHVINYDIPNDYDTYIHRIGRTGRAGKTGKALTFIPH